MLTENGRKMGEGKMQVWGAFALMFSLLFWCFHQATIHVAAFLRVSLDGRLNAWLDTTHVIFYSLAFADEMG